MTSSEATAFAESLRVYTEYDEHLPHPGSFWTRFVCISDTHSRTRYPVPPGDVLLHAGDLCRYGSLSDLNTTLNWLKEMPHPLKMLDAGNETGERPSCLQGALSAQLLIRSTPVSEAGIRYLQHEFFEFATSSGKRWKVYGSPVHIYARIPSNTDILLTHTPPYRVLDRTRKGKHAGCPRLAARIKTLPACRLHVFGHIHEAHGAVVAKDPTTTGRVSVNAAVASGGKAIIVDMK
ncbi:Metallo-dependent phosphatase [Gloeophyllum trabeum ATCC 11539]|uniref:Metallo-dependent phosphatase n=1 Tax=Gloeophyllum trabeum (strain ATCC 11539 / FP-39264 / Madison 617) TaxID=670483 RepID=S7QGE4_GLOTA|nr:Metallo-dependent phosphatase [Gloeophyllum trabeum ATCC 11539]EPQ58253.1 Metallo-dependent phosphatase [Gloeophyllum trabeum ATCC 11539]